MTDTFHTPAELTTLIVNDSMTAAHVGDPFKIAYSHGWAMDAGLPDRFEGGDEHWTTSVQFGDSYPSFELYFVGVRAELFGHKVPAGGMATVTLDGKIIGRINYYAPERVERVSLFATDTLPYGEHTLTVTVIPDRDPAAGDTHEASIDYAAVLTAARRPVTGICPSTESFLLEPGMTAPITYALTPDYATESPAVTLTAEDPTVATVAPDGTVTAVAPGKTAIILTPESGDFAATVAVTVREPLGGDLIVTAGSASEHTRQDRYDKHFASLDLTRTALSAVAWQDDIATAKIDLLTKCRAVSNICAVVGAFVSDTGTTLAAAVTVSPIRNTLAHDTGHLIPDVIGGAIALDLPAQAVGSVWIRVDTPADAAPGVYTAPVTVTADGVESTTLTLSLEVIGLARPAHSAALELWQYPYSADRYYSGKSTDDYFGARPDGLWRTHLDPALEAGRRSQVELFASAGGSAVTVTIVEDPWNSQTPDPYPSMVKWTRTADGAFIFDFADLDSWVRLNEDCGITGPILSFSMADWANQVTYMDEATATVIAERLTPGSDRWKAVWGAFLAAYRDHMSAMGWFDRTYMAMDERPAELVEAVLDLVESVRTPDGKSFKTALAVFTHETEHLFDRITDLSLAYYMKPEWLQQTTAHRRALGLTTTLYTCGPQHSALENPPCESVYTLWYCERMGADGFLRWALDAFNDQPLRASTHRLFAAGDIYLIYPDDKTAEHPVARTSPRFEKLAEGCRDVAKLRYLASLSDAYAAEVQAILQSPDLLLPPARAVAIAQDRLHALARRVAAEN